jgi:hypothetical protein
MGLSARNQSLVDGAELGYAPLGSLVMKKQSHREVYHMEAFNGRQGGLPVSR